MLIVVALALTRGGTGPVSDGERAISNADEVLREAESAMREEVTLADAAIADGAGCWFSYPSAEATTPNSFLRCGPVMFTDSAADAPWMTYALTLTPDFLDESATTATLDGESGRSSKLAAGEDLRRPDGRRAPSADDIDLAAPPPPPLEERHIAMASNDLGLQFEAPEDGRLYSAETKLDIQGVATATEVGEGADRMIAPDGHEIVVVKFAAEGDGVVAEDGYYTEDGYNVDDDASSSANLVLSVDDVRRPFPGWGGDGPHHVAFVVPEDASEVELVLEENGVRSVFSLSELERTEGSSALYVDNPKVYVQRAYNSRVEWEDAGGWPREAVADGRLDNIRLTPWTESLGPAPAGHAWVLMEWATFDRSMRGADSHDVVLNKTATALVGEEIHEATSEESRVIAIPVPGDVTEVTLTYRPVVMYTSRGYHGSKSGELTFPDSLTLTVNFETGKVAA